MSDVVEYLLAGDPSIRWQTLQDLTDAPADAVAEARASVASEGWGARLLALQAEDGQWDGGTYRPGWADDELPFFDAWTATHFSLQSLMEYGLHPESEAARTAIGRVAANVTWGGTPYFEGETEPCINGVALAIGAYFGQDSSRIVTTLLADQHTDGGWNCWTDDEPDAPSSFHSTICALEGLRAWPERDDAIAEALHRGEEYLLDRALLRSKSTGEYIDLRFTMPSAPARWYYDVLRALDYFRLARPERDPRCAEGIELLRSKQLPNGMFLLENTHQGPIWFEPDMEGEGFPSRWVTLRALRVLRWWGGAPHLRADISAL